MLIYKVSNDTVLKTRIYTTAYTINGVCNTYKVSNDTVLKTRIYTTAYPMRYLLEIGFCCYVV